MLVLLGVHTLRVSDAMRCGCLTPHVLSADGGEQPWPAQLSDDHPVIMGQKEDMGALAVTFLEVRCCMIFLHFMCREQCNPHPTWRTADEAQRDIGHLSNFYKGKAAAGEGAAGKPSNLLEAYSNCGSVRSVGAHQPCTKLRHCQRL